MRFWKKGLALLLSILMVLSMCGFAESQPDETPATDPVVTPVAETTTAPDPTAIPDADTTVEPTAVPDVEPTVEPTAVPDADTTVEPTVVPDAEPTAVPDAEPTVEPTAVPDVEPTAEPTVDPTAEPTVDPTAEPTVDPTADPNATPEPCKHEEINQWETNNCFVGVSNITEDTHTSTYQRIYEGYCNKCGLNMDPWMETEEVVEDHWFRSGSDLCARCGYNRNANCAHETIIWNDDTETDWSWDFIDATSHRVIGQELRYGECEKCHKSFTENIGDPVVTVEPHNIEYSYCSDCGFNPATTGETTCQHKNVHYDIRYFGDSDMGGDVYIERDGLCVQTAGWAYVYVYCDDCGKKIGSGDKYLENQNYVHDSHDFPRGGDTCIRCGYQNLCKHENAVVGKDYTDRRNAKDNGDGTHSYIATFFCYNQCLDCGAWFSETIENEPVTESHRMDDEGRCYVCGAIETDPVACTHPNVTSVTTIDYDWYGMSAEYIDENVHEKQMYVKTYAYNYCTDCGQLVGLGMLVETEIKTFLLPHEVSEYNNGYCWICDHAVKSEFCTHDPEYIYYEPWIEFNCLVEDGVRDESGHECIYDQWLEPYCGKCGEYMEDKDSTYQKLSGVLPHEYDENNRCVVCGYTIPCKHENIHTYEDYLVENYTPVNEKTHSALLKMCDVVVCEDCGYTVYNFDHYETEISDHFIFEGQCPLCNYIPDCRHPNLKPDSMLSWNDTWFEYQNAACHFKVTVSEEIGVCPDCGLEILINRDEERLPYQPHVYDDDGWCDCGAEKPCTHPKAYDVEQRDFRETRYIPVKGSDTQHAVVIYTRYRSYCPDCDQYVGDPAEPEPVRTLMSRTIAHTFVDGVCKVCEFGCVHPEAQRTYGQPVVTATTDAVDDTFHTTTTITTTGFTCALCTMDGTRIDTAAGDNVKHSYKDDGKGNFVCADCGHTCGHANATAVDAPVFDHYEITEAGHASVSTVTTTGSCPDCGNSSVQVKTVTAPVEAHQWDNGACKVCGYKCLHSEVTKETISEVLPYESDDAQHCAVTVETLRSTCKVCGLVSDSDPVTVKGNAEAHTYTDGACTVCGHECAHSGKLTEKDVFAVKAYTSDNSEEHSVLGDTHHVVTCDLCATMISDEITDADVVYHEAHGFSDRKCTLCGYTKPAPAATPAPATEMPVVQDEQILTEVPADEVVHGVAASENLRMGVAMVRVMRSITEEYGKDTEVRFVNVDKVLAGAEYKALESLSPDEGILVVLSLLGHLNEVNVAADDLGFELSEDAQILIDAIAARIADMDDAALAEFTALLAEAFPVFTTDGDVEQTEITIEIKLRDDNTYRLERYTFRCEDGVWYLASLAN